MPEYDKTDGFEPNATRLVEDARERLSDYRKHCRQQIHDHQKALEFWQKEAAIVSEALPSEPTDATSLVDTETLARATEMRSRY